MVTKYKIKSSEDWKNVKGDEKETLLFKYSPVCGISYGVERKFNKWLEELSDKNSLNYARLNVITSRSLSREIADELNVRHESPQLIWLTEDGKVKWHASHYSITENELNSNLK